MSGAEADRPFTLPGGTSCTCSSPEALLAVARQALGRPVELVGLAAPFSGAGGRERRPAVPPGWLQLPLESDERCGPLLVAPAEPAPEPQQVLILELVRSLLAAQRQRNALGLEIRSERRATLVRRLVIDPAISRPMLARAAQEAELKLAEHYWPALLRWQSGHPGPRSARAVGDLGHRQLSGTLTVAFDPTTIVILFPDTPQGTTSAATIERRLLELVRAAHRLGHPSVRGIAGERSVDLLGLRPCVRELLRLLPCLPDPGEDVVVLGPRSMALTRLLDALDRPRALDFVASCIGPLLDYDEDRGTNLARVLELALDFQRRDDAARAGYMHRNTFRRQLAHALDLVSGDLDDPQDRLALQLALRLRCLRRSREGVAAGNGRQRTRPTPIAAAL